jgi:hypothetical protein
MSSKHSNSNKIIVVVVLVLVVLFGVGQFFTSSNISTTGNQTASTSTQSADATPATQIIAYIPPTPASSTPVLSGSCWTNSIAAPSRADAWRCAVGNGISDPCFEIPNSSSSLLCDVNPAVSNSTSTFVLKLTKALPRAQAVQNIPAAEKVWLIQLAGGRLCTPFEGTRPFTAAGDSANYDCAPGSLGNDVLIFGDLNTSSSVWTANIGTLSTPTSSLPTMVTSSTVPVTAVWD